jgi:D-aminopeptidase
MTACEPDPDLPRAGALPSGPRDSICDLDGVTVGHCTLDAGPVQTGVTVLCPHGGDPYRDKTPAGLTVFNGFGKSAGLTQAQELGVIETPIALTNTFGVGAVFNAQVLQAIRNNPGIGRELPTVNPLVFECNDGYLNDIQSLHIAEAHYLQAHGRAGRDFAQGAVGAGRGMSSFGLKGGIGSASRVAQIARGRHYQAGALVLSKFGRLAMLIVAGRPLGRLLAERLKTRPPGAEGGAAPQIDKGSIIMLLGTDAPLDARQLRRLSLRAGAGLARAGSNFGHGSGDIALAFSTAYTVPHLPERDMPAVAMLHESRLDPLFDAAAEAVEQAIIAALWRAETVSGRDGHERLAVRDLIPEWREWLAGAAPRA